MYKIFSGSRVTKSSSPVPHGQSEQFRLKSIKETYIPAKVINPCQFITDPLNFSRIIFHQSLSKHLVTGRFGPIPVRTPGRFGSIPFRSGSFRPDFRGGSFRPNFGGSFRPTLIYLDF